MLFRFDIFLWILVVFSLIFIYLLIIKTLKNEKKKKEGTQ